MIKRHYFNQPLLNRLKFFIVHQLANQPSPLPPLMTNWKRSNRKRTLTPLATPPSTIPAPVFSPTHDGWVALVVFREAAHSTPGYICRSTRSTASAGKFLKIESSTGGQRLTCAYTNSLWMMQTYTHAYVHTYIQRGLSERKEGWSRD